jgi:hypothetical protein
MGVGTSVTIRRARSVAADGASGKMSATHALGCLRSLTRLMQTRGRVGPGQD